MVAFEKYGQHQSLNLQAERFARESVELSLSTLSTPADLVGHATVALEPLHALIAEHARAADRLRGDDPPCRSWPGAGQDRAALWTLCARRSPLCGRGPARRAVLLLD
jgi:hypothetical protein